jgi:hypothetical protein
LTEKKTTRLKPQTAVDKYFIVYSSISKSNAECPDRHLRKAPKRYTNPTKELDVFGPEEHTSVGFITACFHRGESKKLIDSNASNGLLGGVVSYAFITDDSQIADLFSQPVQRLPLKWLPIHFITKLLGVVFSHTVITTLHLRSLLSPENQ